MDSLSPKSLVHPQKVKITTTENMHKTWWVWKRAPERAIPRLERSRTPATAGRRVLRAPEPAVLVTRRAIGLAVTCTLTSYTAQLGTFQVDQDLSVVHFEREPETKG